MAVEKMMLRLYALGGAVDVNLDGSCLDEDKFRRLWARALVEPGRSTPVVEGPETPTTPPVVHLQQPTTFESATQRITKAFIEPQWGKLLMLHAGAVADPVSGRALAFAAPGGTGKSTLSRLLGRQFGYLTDETVGIHPETLEVFPYQKPVTWADVQGRAKREHAPDDLGLLPAPTTPHLARLIVLRRTDGAAATFTPLGLLDALGMLVPESSSLSKLPRPLHLLADVLDKVGGVTLVEYGEAEDVVEWCRESLLGESSLASPAAQPRSAEVAVDDSSDPQLVSRRPVPDFLAEGDLSAVLLEDRLLRLGPVATAIMELLTRPRSVGELATALADRFGAPADLGLIPAVEQQLRTLAEYDIVNFE